MLEKFAVAMGSAALLVLAAMIYLSVNILEFFGGSPE